MESTEDVKNKIIEVADKHFRQYGFRKTTMAEIAKDCHMSAANLYRYFESKEEMGVDVASHCLTNGEAFLRQVVRQKGSTASQKLEDFVLKKVRYTFDFFANQPRLSELVEFITLERNELISRHKETVLSLLAEILAEGNRNGEFNIPDILETAQTIMFATMPFSSLHTIMLGICSLEETETQAKAVVNLLIKGISSSH